MMLMMMILAVIPTLKAKTNEVHVAQGFHCATESVVHCSAVLKVWIGLECED